VEPRLLVSALLASAACAAIRSGRGACAIVGRHVDGRKLGCPLFLSDVMLTTLFSLVLHRKERAVTGSFTGLYLYRFEGGENDSIVFRNQKKNDSIYKK
jgi:hypothetical protein